MNILKHISKAIIIIILSSIIGLITLFLVYLLPTASIKANISRGAETLLLQSPAYSYADGYKSAILDNETDAIILNTVAFDTTNSIKDAINAPRYSYEGKEANLYSLMAYLNGDPVSDAYVSTYPRYWHGYNVILKPFFSIFDYNDFKIFNQAIQFILIISVILLMVKNNLKKYLWGFLMMIIFWNPATIGVSLQYAPCFYISIISSIVILSKSRFLFNSQKSEENILLFFLVVGIVTSYFDFLTYPLVTFGVPCIFYYLIYDSRDVVDNSGNNSAKSMICKLFLQVSHWACGYILMWASKWFLGSIITDENVLSDAFNKINERSSSAIKDISVGRLQVVIELTRDSLIKWPYVIMFVATAVILLIAILEEKKCGHLSFSSITLPLIILGFIPFVWFFVISNHSYIHPRLVYRILGITIFAWYCAVMNATVLNRK